MNLARQVKSHNILGKFFYNLPLLIRFYITFYFTVNITSCSNDDDDDDNTTTTTINSWILRVHSDL